MAVLHEVIDHSRVDIRAALLQDLLELVLLLLGLRFVERLEVDVVLGVGFHVGEGGAQGEGVRWAGAEFAEGCEEVEEGGGVRAEGGEALVLEEVCDVKGDLYGLKSVNAERNVMEIYLRFDECASGFHSDATYNGHERWGVGDGSLTLKDASSFSEKCEESRNNIPLKP